MDTPTLETVIRLLRKEVKKMQIPAVGIIADQSVDRPFDVLISTILSLRTKDVVTMAASRRLLTAASTPQAILRLPVARLEKLIYPVSFYRVKARSLQKTCSLLLERHGGQVPRTMEELLELPGVGRKTANLVLTLGFDEYGICVDTHVHRIMNLFGYVKTKTPDETEMILRGKLPKKYWKTFNDILVAYGQNLCVPVSPWCSRCSVAIHCEKKGLKRSR